MYSGSKTGTTRTTITALHLPLVHPSCHQMKQVMHRYFYTLDMDKTVEHVSQSCHHCTSLKHEQSTSDPVESVGLLFAADILKWECQLILILREYVTSYTAASIVSSEQGLCLGEALVRLCIDLDGPPAVIRTDPAPGFMSLLDCVSK